MNIITVTLNPAIDIHISAEDFFIDTGKPYSPLRCDSGGKGVNVSRALTALGVSNICCIAVGNDNAEEYIAPLLKSGLNLYTERVAGAVRQNLHANTEGGDISRSGQGACVDNSALLRIKERILPMIGVGDFICLCGSLPPHCDKNFVIDTLLDFKAKGARIILDSQSFMLDDIRNLCPYMIKPNIDELKALLTIESGNIGKGELISLLKMLVGDICDSIFLTLGKNGAIYASKELLYHISAPDIDAISTTGAGDSLIAGYLYAQSLGADLPTALRIAAAFGTAACLREGTLPPKRDDTERLMKEISVTEIAE